MSECSDCHGSGETPFDAAMPCIACGGTGVVRELPRDAEALAERIAKEIGKGYGSPYQWEGIIAREVAPLLEELQESERQYRKLYASSEKAEEQAATHIAELEAEVHRLRHSPVRKRIKELEAERDGLRTELDEVPSLLTALELMTKRAEDAESKAQLNVQYGPQVAKLEKERESLREDLRQALAQVTVIREP